VAALAAAGVARADADPASDTLYVRRLFLPYTQKVSAPAEAKLRGAIGRAARSGKEIRVALIADPSDLGGVPDLYGKPALYAPFLSKELQFVYPGRVLVVMPQGAGFAKGGRPVSDPTVRAVRPGRSGNALASAATQLVEVLSGQRPRSSVTVSNGPAATSATKKGEDGPNLLVRGVEALIVVALAFGGYRLLRWWARR
jgi:hypothetical protein